ncbi:AraC family transcriptional regulator N-terminal domain-containing protein [Streptomyces sp. NPDC050560]|uniref:AraC family transcriptional regulator n=1 Tax=Streptomyces sp. NPDC050560 TaxID=3365630 RepID=UPI0037BC4AE4
MGLEELCALIDRHARRGTPPVEGLLLSRSERPTAPEPSLTGPVLALVAQGAKRTGLGERTYEYRAGQYLVVTVDLPVTGHFSEASPGRPFLGVGLELRPAAIADLLLQHATAPGPARPPGGAVSGIAVSTAPYELVDALVRLLRLLERPADRPVLAPLIEKEILWRLVTGEQGAVIRQIGLADSTLSQIGRAVRWIRDHHASALRVGELADMCAMSASSFHRHFRAVTAMTPLQFQKNIRLQQARLLLMSRDDDVEDVGYAIGYDSPSQFSREYRRQYGLPPGRDAERLRGAERGSRASRA